MTKKRKREVRAVLAIGRSLSRHDVAMAARATAIAAGFYAATEQTGRNRYAAIGRCVQIMFKAFIETGTIRQECKGRKKRA
jgi:hypothetical protein